jgi:Pyruvate/2-oxoacid:ferredoxin oxidoreductase delta subunit
MLRKIVRIDEDKCDGCGLCINNCAEGALRLVNGKARLVSESYCDGLGACLGECPREAIAVEERDVKPFDEALATAPGAAHSHGHQCPGSMARTLQPRHSDGPADSSPDSLSALLNWPVQLRLVNPGAPFLNGADLLLVADCVPFAYADFHRRFLRSRPVVIGCPKLDEIEYYAEKLSEILRVAQPRSLTVIRMEVPCCGGLTHLARQVLAAAGGHIAFTEVVIGIQGRVLQEAAIAAAS